MLPLLVPGRPEPWAIPVFTVSKHPPSPPTRELPTGLATWAAHSSPPAEFRLSVSGPRAGPGSAVAPLPARLGPPLAPPVRRSGLGLERLGGSVQAAVARTAWCAVLVHCSYPCFGSWK